MVETQFTTFLTTKINLQVRRVYLRYYFFIDKSSICLEQEIVL